MAPYLPDELLLEIAQYVVSQSALAALSQVSKRFYHLFAPFLYRDFWIDERPQLLSQIPDSCFSWVQSLTLGEFFVCSVNLSEAGFFFSLGKMRNLRALEIPGGLIEDFLTNSSGDKLHSFQGIQDITLTGPWFRKSRQAPKIPRFQNLRKFHLLDIDFDLSPRNCRQISNVILSSPGLRDLALTMLGLIFHSVDPPTGAVFLPTIIKYCSTPRLARRLPLVKLSHLLLGDGFLPCVGSESSFDGVRDYLSLLTDLSALQSLKLLSYLAHDDNDELFTEISEVDPEVFKKAVNLRRLVVVVLTPGIEKLLKIPDSTKRLVDLTVLTAFRQPDSTKIQAHLNSRRFEWKRISLYCWPRYLQEMTQAMMHFRRVTELKIDISEHDYPSIKTSSFVSAFPNLEILLFPRGEILGSQQSSFGQGQRIFLEYEVDGEEFISRATDIFRRNRELVSRDKEFRPLRYVGFSTHIYTCSLFPSNKISRRANNVFSVEYPAAAGEYDITIYQVTQLSKSEAIAFGDVRRMVFLPEIFFNDID